MTASPSVARPRWQMPLYAVIAFVATMALTMWWQTGVGIARDEVVYMNAGDGYVAWWGRVLTGEESTSRAKITKSWGGPRATDNNREHPPLVKTLMGISHAVAVKWLGVRGTSELASYRFVGALFMGLLALIVFVWCFQLWGVASGAWACVLAVCMPRLLGYASVACFDVPMAAMWLASAYAYWRAQSSPSWCVGLAIVLGLALATKHNALMLPWAFGVHSLWRAVSLARKTGGVWWRLLLQRWRIIVAMACAPAVLLAIWPWLWIAPAEHAWAWISFHLKHVHYNYEYLGANYNHPPFPWHVPLVTTLLTVPLVTLAAAGLGARALWERRGAASQDGAVGLLVISGLVAIVPFGLGRTPIFGAEKHWLAAIVVIAMMGGHGVAYAFARFAQASAAFIGVRGSKAVRVFGGLVIVGALAQELSRGREEGLAHYNAIAGGAVGGADLGMNRQFWGLAARQALPVLDRLAHRDAAGRPLRIYTHDAAPAWGWYRRFGMVSPQFVDSGAEQKGIESADVALVIYEKHFARHEAMIWQAYGTAAPVAVITAGGVPVVSVYVNPRGALRTEGAMTR